MIRFLSPLNLFFIAIGVVATIVGFAMIPASMALPAHWGIDGQPDATLPRNWALLQMVAVIAVVWGIFWAIDRFGNAERRAASTHVMNVALSAITGLMVLIQVLLVMVGLGIAVDVVRAVVVGIALMQVALGNVFPKSQPNNIAGLRIRSALASPANWQATHRLVGKLTIASGLALLIATLFLPVGIWLFVAVFAAWIAPLSVGLVFSLLYARSHRLDVSP
jgi:uncharacterized membrane protein